MLFTDARPQGQVVVPGTSGQAVAALPQAQGPSAVWDFSGAQPKPLGVEGLQVAPSSIKAGPVNPPPPPNPSLAGLTPVSTK